MEYVVVAGGGGGGVGGNAEGGGGGGAGGYRTGTTPIGAIQTNNYSSWCRWYPVVMHLVLLMVLLNLLIKHYIAYWWKLDAKSEEVVQE